MDPTNTPARNQKWLLALLLVVATVMAYQPAWNAGFIWDDDDYVTHNPLLTAPDGLKRIWFSLDSPSQYFPLTYTSFRVERSLWGLNATGYHWVNILLHAINALLVWRLLGRLKIPGAWLASAIFALHPVNVESVAWITELKNVQSLFFSLLALLMWVEFVESERKRWYGLTLLFYGLALLSKTTACTLPAAMLLILWLKRKPVKWSWAVQMVPLVMMGVAMGLVSMWWERHHQGTEGEIYSINLVERILIASRAAWFYLGKLLWPADLTFNYPLWKISATNPLAYAWLIAGAGLCALIFFLRRFVGRSLEVAMVYFVATLAPLLGFVMLYTFRYTFVTDHYQYVACLGPIALAAAWIWRWTDSGATASWSAVALHRFKSENAGGPAHSQTLRPSRVPILYIAVCSVVLVTLGTLTWRQCGMYKDLETLWRTTLDRNPNSFMGHNNLGAIFLSKGQVNDAIAHFQKALEILPDHANAHGNLGNALLQTGQVDEALAHFQRALEVEPSAKAHSDLGFGLLQKGRVDDAIAELNQALKIQPDLAEAHNHLGWALLEKREPREALAHFRKALELQPDSADNCYNLGTAWLHNGRPDEAILCFRKALSLRPDFAKAYNNLGSALLQTGQTSDAIAQLQKALELQPNNAEARNNLGWVLLQNGRVDEAIGHFEAALKLQPNFVGAQYNLGNSYFQLGRLNDAIARYQKVLELQPDNAEVRNNLGWVLLQSGRVDDAIAQFEAVIKAEPEFALAHGNLATALLRKGQANDAIAQYQALLKLQPDAVPILAELAWVLATWPDSAIRNGAQAVELAGRANQLSGGKHPRVLRSLAAAYAENGKLADAVATARRAQEFANSPADAALRDTLQSQIQTYESGSPFRDSSQTNSPAGPIQH